MQEKKKNPDNSSLSENKLDKLPPRPSSDLWKKDRNKQEHNKLGLKTKPWEKTYIHPGNLPNTPRKK